MSFFTVLDNLIIIVTLVFLLICVFKCKDNKKIRIFGIIAFILGVIEILASFMTDIVNISIIIPENSQISVEDKQSLAEALYYINTAAMTLYLIPLFCYLIFIYMKLSKKHFIVVLLSTLIIIFAYPFRNVDYAVHFLMFICFIAIMIGIIISSNFIKRINK